MDEGLYRNSKPRPLIGSLFVLLLARSTCHLPNPEELAYATWSDLIRCPRMSLPLIPVLLVPFLAPRGLPAASPCLTLSTGPHPGFMLMSPSSRVWVFASHASGVRAYQVALCIFDRIRKSLQVVHYGDTKNTIREATEERKTENRSYQNQKVEGTEN